MAEVETARALLIMALQDLHDGEAAMVERLPTLCGHARDPGFLAVISADQDRSAEQRDRIEALARSLDAETQDGPNIWLRAILDDAENDSETIEPGRLLDIALTGALRKAKQAERVSYETAIALARRLGLKDATAILSTSRDEEAAADQALAGVLESLAAEL